MNQYKTACGGTINIPHQAQQHLIAHPDVLAHLHAAISQLHLPRLPRKIEEEIDVGQIIGRSGVVKTAPLQMEEKALFSFRTTRKLPSRVAKVCDYGQETSKIVIIARPSSIENQYDLITSSVGTLAKKEPWDKSIVEKVEFQECLSFWCVTALVYDPTIMGPVFESSWQDVLTLGKSRFCA